MSIVSGTRSTENILSTRRRGDIDDRLWMISAPNAVLAFMARNLRKKPTIDPEFSWFEKTQPSRYDAVNNGGGYTAGATSVVVDDGTKFRAGDIVKVIATGEQMRVTAVSTNTLTVSRGYGTTAAGSLADDGVLAIIGNAFAEGAAIGTPRTAQTVKKTNYTQIFREAIGVTGTQSATELYAEKDDLAQLRKEHLDIHMKDIERSFLFGEPKEDTSSTANPIRTTGGAEYFISSNITTQSDLTEAEFEGFIQSVFSKGGDKKMGIFAPLIASAVNSWAKGKLQMFPKDKTYGIAVMNYLSVHGEISFALERLFTENTTWAGSGFVFDMNKLIYRYLAGNGRSRDTKLLKDRQTAGTDQMLEEYLTEAGLQLVDEATHGLLTGVSTYS